MASELSIFNGSYKGVPIVIRSASINGGRRKVIKRFPSRDTQNVEDLGLIPRQYSLEIVVSDRGNEDYFVYRDRLLQALETEESGILIHPLYGRIESIASGKFDMPETFERFGESYLVVDMFPDENTGIPQTSRNVLTQVVAENNLVKSAVIQSISENFSISPRLPDSRQGGIAKIEESLSFIERAANFVGEASDTVNQFNSDVRDARNRVNELLGNPQELALQIDSFFTSIRNIAPSAQNSLNSFSGLFGFGSLDTNFEQNTASRIERQRNNDTINSSINALALGEAYLAISQIEFETQRALLVERQILDSQFDQVIASSPDLDVINAITDMRVLVFDFLEDQRLNASRIITVNVRETSARLTSFDYYGDDDRGQQIAGLNELSDISFIDGDIEVVTT